MEIPGKVTNSNICRAGTDGPFSTEICQGCTINPEKKIPYWAVRLAMPIVAQLAKHSKTLLNIIKHKKILLKHFDTS